MFYDQRGRITVHHPDRAHPTVKVEMRPGSFITIKAPPALVQGRMYDLIIGRGSHLGWVGLHFHDKGQNKFKMKPLMCATQLRAFKPMRDANYEVNFLVRKNLLYVQLPDGSFELEGWWYKLPDVSDNPQAKRREIQDVQRVRSYDGDSGE